MSRMSLLIAVVVLPCASGAPYWVSWEGDDYPENEGWERIHWRDDAQAVRTRQNGVMTLDGLASIEIIDSYRIERETFDPELGETFVVQWGVRVREVLFLNENFPYDPGWGMRSDEGWAASFVMGVDEIHNLYTQLDASFAPGLLLNWEFRSEDMRTYDLYLNNEVVSTGNFIPTSSTRPRIAWGDFVAGTASLSDWDYFRFGVVPEPSTAWLLLSVVGLAHARKGRHPIE